MEQRPMVSYFWAGEKVRLRPFRESDWEVVWSERHDSEATRLFEPGIQLPVTEEQMQAWVRESAAKPLQVEGAEPLHFVVETLEGEPAGFGAIHDRNPQAGTFGLALRIYRRFWRRGYAREALTLLLRYGFHEMRYQKANSAMIDCNVPSIKMHIALGFELEGRIRRNVFTGGRYYDEVLFGMTREEFDARIGP
jgi:RimJ/RimL family protein N-acetyltransferase